MGCVHCLDHAARRAKEDRDVTGARISQAGRCGEPPGISRRSTRQLKSPKKGEDEPCHIIIPVPTSRSTAETLVSTSLIVTVITDRKVTADRIGPHEDLHAEFPYLGPPHRRDRCSLLNNANDARQQKGLNMEQ